MTLETCKRLFEHYTKVGDKVNAEEMRKRIAAKGGQVSQPKPAKK